MKTQKDLIKRVAELTGKSQKDIKTVIDAVEATIVETVKAEDKIKVFHGVTFEGVEKPARVCRVPMTGETVKVPAKTVCKVKVTTGFKNQIA